MRTQSSPARRLLGRRLPALDRAPDTWEYAMPDRARTEQQRRLVAGGHGVRAALPAGRRAAAAALGLPGGGR